MITRIVGESFALTLLCFCTSAILAQTHAGDTQSPPSALGRSSGAVKIGTCLNRVAPYSFDDTQVYEAPSSDSQLGQEAAIFPLALPGILREHARMEYLMWKKHMYGSIVSRDPAPAYNPLSTTADQLAIYLDSVQEKHAPGGILVYWRSQSAHDEKSDLCVGLVLAGRRMLVEASPVQDREELRKLLTFDPLADARVARLRVPLEPGSSVQKAPTPLDLDGLSRALLPPSIAGALALHRVKTLLIVPIEDIGATPFSALPIRGKSTLIDYSTVTIAPGFYAIEESTNSDPTISAKDKMLIVGDPDLTANPKWIFPPLPGARSEAQQVADLFGKRPLVWKAATRQAVVTALTSRPSPKLLYFATHAITDEVNPQDGSFLALTGANLRTREIGKLKLTGNPLVVLSACQTGLGKVFDQGGIFGMALAWHYAGAGRVVVSLWNVPDAPTRDLMAEFSKGLLQGELPADALATSMLRLRQRDSDPRDWAGFTVFGGLPLRPNNPQSSPVTRGPAKASIIASQAVHAK